MILFLGVVDLAAQVAAPHGFAPIELRASLLSPLTSRFTRKGDIVSVRVLEPDRLQGSILEGDVREAHDGGASNKCTSIQFQFHRLHLSGSTILVSATLLRLANSRGQKDVDDDGLSIEIDQGAERGGGLSSVTSALHISGSKQGSTSYLTGPIRVSTTSASLSLAIGSELVLHIMAKEQ
jgi:hypothetical protein